jgi:hypothetical protein
MPAQQFAAAVYESRDTGYRQSTRPTTAVTCLPRTGNSTSHFASVCFTTFRPNGGRNSSARCIASPAPVAFSWSINTTRRIRNAKGGARLRIRS